MLRSYRFSPGLQAPAELGTVARSHVIAWRKSLEARNLTPASIRRKLSALSSLFDYLCEHNAVHGNPVDGVKRPAANDNEGSTPALGDAQARRPLEAPAPDTLKGVRDRAILDTLLYHGIRRDEFCLLRLRDMQSRQADIAKIQEWLGHANVSTTRLYEAQEQARGEPRHFM